MTTDAILTDEDVSKMLVDLGYVYLHHPGKVVINGGTTILNIIRALEREILKSPEIQALRKDAAILDWLISQEAQVQSMVRPNGGNSMYRVGWPDDGEYSVSWYGCPRTAIDAAMEQQI